MRIWYQVRDLGAARAFYTDVLGFTETFVDEDGRWAALDRDQTEIALTVGDPQEEGGVAMIDVEDVKAERERLAAASAARAGTVPVSRASSDGFV